MPLVIEIVDTEEKINLFIPVVEEIFEESNAGGLITIEAAEIIKYSSTN
jgi:PII-like signaling protein